MAFGFNNFKHKMADQIFFEESQQEWEIIDDKIQRQIVGYDDQVMMVIVKFQTGGIGTLHHHPHIQVTYVSEGKFEVTINNNKKILQKGDSFFVPTEEIHGVVCLEAGILVDVFSPKRQDFLK